MSDELRLVSPATGHKQTKGIEFPVTFECQAVSGVATLQFSSSEDGPWTTCEGYGQGGSVECVVGEGNSPAFELSAKQYEAAYVRGGLWPDQGLTGPPVVASNVVHWPAPLHFHVGGG